MLLSMTGYGQGTASDGEFEVRVEVRSVNHKYRDVSIKIPPGYLGLEEPMTKAISARIRRGRIDVFLSVQRVGSALSRVRVDSGVLLDYIATINVGLDGTTIAGRPGAEFFLNLPGVLSFEEEIIDAAHPWPVTSRALDQALSALIEMRRIEGLQMERDLESSIQSIKGRLESLPELAPGVVDSYRTRLRNKLEELGANQDLSEERLASEVALFADRCDIHEEIVRFRSHIDQFDAAMRLDEPVGRRLEFLIQEMFREANTISAKANDASISAITVEARSQLEKMREQVQNVE